MFETTKRKQSEDKDDYVIRHKPNRIILFVDRTKWYWPVILFFLTLILYIFTNPSSTDQSNAPTTPEGTILLLGVFAVLLLVPFYIGVKLGANLYRPRKSNLTNKQLKLFDQLLGKGENLKVEFIKKDGKVEILAREQSKEKKK